LDDGVQPLVTGVLRTLVPRPGDQHGPLPPLLVGLTVVTGLVDAVSYLLLGKVFVANMTGNVVFLGFALAGAHGFSPAASVLALAGFAAGALAWGRMQREPQHRGRTLLLATSAEAVLVGISFLVAAAAPNPGVTAVRYPLIVLLGLAMGTQNAAVRALKVPDLTTTVLTMIITGIAADAPLGEGAAAASGRRLVAVIAMLLGALFGALLVLHTNEALAIAVPFALVVAITGLTSRAARDQGAWTAFP
jgi:uncharacterized membrane protein YoaK (UPF0700 family)